MRLDVTDVRDGDYDEEEDPLHQDSVPAGSPSLSDRDYDEEEDPLHQDSVPAGRPSLLRQQEDSSTLQSTFREGTSTDPPLLDVSNIAKKWPDPHFCTRCGWIGQGKVQK